MKHVGTRTDPKDIVSQEQLDPWAMSPVGSFIELWDHLPGVTEPPTSKSYRWVRLTASDSYNDGVLTGEIVSGSGSQIEATAIVSDAASPLNGQTIRLINTERRMLRPGSSGTIQADAFQGHGHAFYWSNGARGTSGASGSIDVISAPSNSPSPANDRVKESISDGVNATPRTSSETRPKNIGATYYLRIR